MCEGGRDTDCAGLPGAWAGRPSWSKRNFEVISSSDADLSHVVIEHGLRRAHSGRHPGNAPTKHLIAMCSGRTACLAWTIDGRRRQARFQAGDIVVHPAGLRAAPRWDADVELTVVVIPPRCIARFQAESGNGGEGALVPAFAVRDVMLQMLVQALVAEHEQPTPADPLYADSMATALVAHVAKRYSPTEAREQLVLTSLPGNQLDAVLDYLRANLARRPSLETMSAIAGVCPSHFAARFRESTGLPPHRYLVRLRLEEAQRLLTRTDLPIAEIAIRTGFADQSHLTRVMRHNTGLTPGALRWGGGGGPPPPRGGAAPPPPRGGGGRARSRVEMCGGAPADA
ncbi:helix-turn-helix domain-containing protein, partial [Saccharopolyspora soli]|uniref:helix-turn-helix domain-containing protein n=1 Tax=Saccharopolyspora soli TaxID=2926618 RepID=UPI001F586DD9